MSPRAVFTEHMTRAAERVLPPEMIAPHADAYGAAPLEARIAHRPATAPLKATRGDLAARSAWLACDTGLNVMLVESILPHCRLARWATWGAMSESVTFL